MLTPRMKMLFVGMFGLLAVAVLLMGMVAVSAAGGGEDPTINTNVVVAGATITVDSTADTVDNEGLCTLREAITAANTDTASGAAGECVAGGGADTISFNIPGASCPSGVCTIAPTSSLPTITQPVTIDGYTQPGATANTLAVGNNAVLRIELSGQSAPSFTDGLNITAGGTTVRGLAINRFSSGSGIQLTGAGATGNTITGNFIGTNAEGTEALDNPTGISISDNATNNRVGTDGNGTNDEAERNVVSGNGGTGIAINGAGTSDNIIAGNRIGTNAEGTELLRNGIGIRIIDRAANNRIGGIAAGEANTIAFNSDDGVQLSFNAGTGNVILSNSIHSNGFSSNALGIDLVGADGINPNDTNDTDSGPNNL